MRVLMVASESVPFAKTGGLADVIGALPRALVRLGHAVDVVMPRYRSVAGGEPVARVQVRMAGTARSADVYATVADGVRTLFVHQPDYFDREYLYGTGNDDYRDNAERFAFLARSALEWGASSGTAYDVVHAHDWQGGLVPLLLQREYGSAPAFRGAPAVLTIHNLAFQGLFDAAWLPRLGLGWDLMRTDALEYFGRISFLKAGIVFSRTITTVSPRYAVEIQSPELGCGFDGILRHRSADLVGILNGIDTDQWDPARDPNLPAPYDTSNLRGKAASKRLVLEVFGLAAGAEARRRPLVGLISRLVDQKGFDLIAAIAPELSALDASFVLLGSGEPRYEDLWRALAARHPDRIGTRFGFDEALAHRIEAGADIFLMPSRFEPCGLNQMYSLRYGTVPVVRATGGLSDTVRNVERGKSGGTGFVFEPYSPEALLAALRRALHTFQNRSVWRRIQLAGMQQDFSWDRSARQYAETYKRATI